MRKKVETFEPYCDMFGYTILKSRCFDNVYAVEVGKKRKMFSNYLAAVKCCEELAFEDGYEMQKAPFFHATIKFFEVKGDSIFIYM